MTEKVLGANAIGFLKGKIEGEVASVIIKGSGAPTTATEGTIGQLYEDTTNGKLYQCTAVSSGTYTWGEVGGSSGPTVVQAIGSSTTDVMSQDATTKMIYPNTTTYGNNRIALGTVSFRNNSTDTYGVAINAEIGAPGSSSPTTHGIAISGQPNSPAYLMKCQRGIAIGSYAEIQNANNSIAIGNNTKILASNGGHIAIGANAQAGRNYQGDTFATAIGSFSQAIESSTVALGAYSRATVKGQFDISTLANGSGSTLGYNDTAYRLLTGLYDPQSAHDAATKGYVDGLVGNIEAALNIINNGSES